MPGATFFVPIAKRGKKMRTKKSVPSVQQLTLAPASLYCVFFVFILYYF